MAHRHKHAGRGIEVVSDMPVERMANLCKQAADQCQVRLDEIRPGQMIFSVRSRLFPDKNRLLAFVVELSLDGVQVVMRSRIISYKTRQRKLLLLIPLEPRQMLGLDGYDRFLHRFDELLREGISEVGVCIVG
jgi:hypothetical protein